jgi:hypothetical protein
VAFRRISGACAPARQTAAVLPPPAAPARDETPRMRTRAHGRGLLGASTAARSLPWPGCSRRRS